MKQGKYAKTGKKLRYTNKKKVSMYWMGKNPNVKKAFECWMKGGKQMSCAEKYGVSAQTLINHSTALRKKKLVRRT